MVNGSVAGGSPRYENNVRNRQTREKPIFRMTLIHTWWPRPKRQKERAKHTRSPVCRDTLTSPNRDLAEALPTREYCSLRDSPPLGASLISTNPYLG